MNMIRACTIICLLSAVSAPSAEPGRFSARVKPASIGEPGQQDTGPDYLIYEMQEGDTLQGIALKYLGGEQHLPELLKFNQVVNPAALQPGALIAIPRAIRIRAVDHLAAAEEALSQALLAEAETYASDEFGTASKYVDASRGARMETDYTKAVALADLGRQWAIRAKDAADQNAVIQQQGKITFIQGQVESSDRSAGPWAAAQVDTPLDPFVFLKTGTGARAEVTLADGSVIQVLEDTQFQINAFLLDRRTGVRRSKLKVLFGNILGRIEPRATEDSEFKINTLTSSIGIRGTVLRLGADAEDTTRLSVLEGNTVFEAAGRAKEVPGNFGTLSKKGKPPQPPVELLPPPEIGSPSQSPFESASQSVTFHWLPLKNGRLDRYHLEIGQDPLFNSIVSEQYLEDEVFNSPVLEEGTYYWQVASIDRDGLEGPPSTVRQIDIRYDFNLAIAPSAETHSQDDQWVLGLENFLVLRPAQRNTTVTSIESSVDDAPFTVTDGTQRFPGDGVYRLRVRGVSASGIKGDIIEQTVIVDGTPPDISVDLAMVKDGDKGDVIQLTATAEDNVRVDRVEYRLGSGPYREYTAPLRISPDAGGDIDFRAVDKVGNVSGEQRVHIMGEWVPR